MGGNLFKLGRISQKEYLEIEREIRFYLDRKLGNCYRIPRYYRNKPDFGDMDIVVSTQAMSNGKATANANDWLKFRQEIVNDLKITQYRSDGRVFSTVYRNLQIDYFTATEEFFESTYNYLSFNDLGNLIGKICRKFNLKYGEKGLAYVYRRQLGNYKKDLLITTDFKKICFFLGLDYAHWQKGFETLEEIFDWAIASPYFSVTPYLEQAKTLERRVKHRTTIQKFIKYIEDKKVDKIYQYLENKANHIPHLIQVFSEANLLEKIATEQEAEKTALQIIQKFNGKLVMQLIPTLQGQELGKFIVEFKKQFNNFELFILINSSEEIQKKILNYYHLHKR
jgi:hypothetical protein